MKESSEKTIREQDEEEDEDDDIEEEDDDDVLERIKRGPGLEDHEQRLLPCIIDAGMSSIVIYLCPHLDQS
jgi:hypothetical protein